MIPGEGGLQGEWYTSRHTFEVDYFHKFKILKMLLWQFFRSSSRIVQSQNQRPKIWWHGPFTVSLQYAETSIHQLCLFYASSRIDQQFLQSMQPPVFFYWHIFILCSYPNYQYLHKCFPNQQLLILPFIYAAFIKIVCNTATKSSFLYKCFLK